MFFFTIEVVQMRDKGLKAYFSDNWNKIDVANFSIFMAYFFLRTYHANSFIDVSEDNIEETGMIVLLMRVLIF